MTSASFSIGAGSLVYEKFGYPAGETQVRLLPEGIRMVKEADEIRIRARVRSAEDIIEIALVASAVRSVASSEAATYLILPYLPYGRADRRFVAGDCFGLQTFATLINALRFDAVVTLDAHSSAVSRGLITSLVDVSPMPLIERAIARFANIHEAAGITLLFPDAGAAQRYAFSDTLAGRVKLQSLYCSKKRDAATGRLSGFDVPAPEKFHFAQTLIVDDICDGGGTFIGIADAIKAHNQLLGLYVTHGIFSKGVDDLLMRFLEIYTSDSLCDFINHRVRVFGATNLLVSACGRSRASAEECAK